MVTCNYFFFARDSSCVPLARILIITDMSEPSSSQHRVTSVYRDIQYLIPPIHHNVAMTSWEETCSSLLEGQKNHFVWLHLLAVYAFINCNSTEVFGKLKNS